MLAIPLPQVPTKTQAAADSLELGADMEVVPPLGRCSLAVPGWQTEPWMQKEGKRYSSWGHLSDGKTSPTDASGKCTLHCYPVWAWGIPVVCLIPWFQFCYVRQKTHTGSSHLSIITRLLNVQIWTGTIHSLEVGKNIRVLRRKCILNCPKYYQGQEKIKVSVGDLIYKRWATQASSTSTWRRHKEERETEKN